jgi:hypothetical protein
VDGARWHMEGDPPSTLQAMIGSLLDRLACPGTSTDPAPLRNESETIRRAGSSIVSGPTEICLERWKLLLHQFERQKVRCEASDAADLRSHVFVWTAKDPVISYKLFEMRALSIDVAHDVGSVNSRC